MWLEITIDEQKCFLQCKITLENAVSVLLYNMNDVLSEQLDFSTLYSRSKDLNKRIQYSEDAIRSAMCGDKPPEVLSMEEEENGVQNLKLKYRVGSRPLLMHWRLRKQTTGEVNQSLLAPLFEAVHDLLEQNSALHTAVEKKDAEIQQYRYEGAILRRSTVATKKFDFETFNEKYTASKSWCVGVNLIGAHLKEQPKQQRAPQIAEVERNNKAKSEEGSAERPRASTSNKTTISPRNRKRKVIQAQLSHIERKLVGRKAKLVYENSPTLTSSQSSTDSQPLAKLSAAAMRKKKKADSESNDELHEPLRMDDEMEQRIEQPVKVVAKEAFRRAVVNVKRIPAVVKTAPEPAEPAEPQVNETLEATSAVAKRSASPPPTELSRTVDAIMRELQELDQRRCAVESGAERP